jgi:hypothetical protein
MKEGEVHMLAESREPQLHNVVGYRSLRRGWRGNRCLALAASAMIAIAAISAPALARAPDLSSPVLGPSDRSDPSTTKTVVADDDSSWSDYSDDGTDDNWWSWV